MKKFKIKRSNFFFSCKKSKHNLNDEKEKLIKYFISDSISSYSSLNEILCNSHHQDFCFVINRFPKFNYLRIKEKNSQKTFALLAISETVISSCTKENLLLIEKAFYISLSTKNIVYLAEENDPLLKEKKLHKNHLKTIGNFNMSNANNNDYPGGLLKNTNFLGKAVDITKIDPAAVSTSLTGINALNFDVTEENSIPSSDGRFGIPLGTKFDPIFCTDVSLDTSVFQENTDIYEKFSFSLSIGGDGEDLQAKASAFSSSFTCDFITENTTENKNTVTYSNATHKLYVLRKNIAYDPKKFVVDDEFQFWVTKKLNLQKPSTFDDFIANVGTHYVTSVVYGGLGYQVLKIDSQSLTQLKEKHISISAAAEEVMLHATASYNKKDTYSSFSQSITSKTVFIGGTVLPHLSSEDKTLDFTDWSESVINEPAAISIKVERISDLLTPDYFQNTDHSLLEKIKKNLDQAITTYLKKHCRAVPKTCRTIMIQDSSQLVGFVQNESPFRSISGFYTKFWISNTYAFPTIRENSPMKFYIASTTNRHVRPLLHGSEIFIIYKDYPPLPYEGYKKFLSWYSTYTQAYFDSTDDGNGYTWIIEKVNRNIDDTIRDGDVIRIKKSISGEPKYISNVPLNDGSNTVTWTRNIKDAEFSIKILN